MTDIAALSSAISGATLQSQVATAVAAKSLDAAKAQGAAVTKLLEGAAELAQQLAPPADGSAGRGIDVIA